MIFQRQFLDIFEQKKFQFLKGEDNLGSTVTTE